MKMSENEFERENVEVSVKVARVQCWENKKGCNNGLRVLCKLKWREEKI